MFGNCGHKSLKATLDQGEQGWHSGESARLPPVWPGFDSWTRRHVGEFVVGSLLAPRGFSPGTPVFPSPQKPTFPNSNSIRNSRATGLSVARLLGVTLVKIYLFIYLLAGTGELNCPNKCGTHCSCSLLP